MHDGNQGRAGLRDQDAAGLRDQGRAGLCPAEEQIRPDGTRLHEQRRNARRTAALVGVIAVLVYVGFILSGVIGR